ncbi:Conidiation protein 6-domain-containing protein, partial [Pyronema omphalodes]
GHKANLHNPNTSEESKEHSRQFLENIDRNSGLHHISNPRDRSTSSSISSASGQNSHSFYPSHSPAGLTDDLDAKNLGNVIGGYKATLHNPRVSEEAKERAAHALEELGVEPDYHPKGRDDDM